MAGTLLHTLLARKALEEATLLPSYREEIRQYPDNYFLGSVVFDLPYYEGLLGQAIMRQTRRDYSYATWGQRLHLRAPTPFCRELLDGARSPALRAFALGAVTHAAVDAVFHPEIERRVRRSPSGRAQPNREHSRIETQMDIVVHEHYLGHVGIGTAYTARELTLYPVDNWERLLETAIQAVHGEAPSGVRIRYWLRNLRRFARLHNRPYPWVPRKSSEGFNLAESALTAAAAGIRRAAKYLDIAGSRLEDPGGPGDKFAEMDDVNLTDGGPPLPPLTHPL